MAADVYMDEALKLAEEYPQLLETGVYHANKGLISLRKGLFDAARVNCTTALRAATKSESQGGQEQAKYCLEQLAQAMKA